MAATLQGGKQAFSITANQCTGNSLAFGESCKIEVNFAPSVEGLSYLDRLTITSGGMDPRYVSLTGKGGAPVAREVSIIPSAYDFGSIITGQHSGYKRFDILNNGSTEEKVSAIGLAGNSDDFEVRDLPDISTPLKPGERISVEVAFTPHSEGAKTAELVVVVVDQTNPVRAELSGQAGGSEQSILRGLILDRYSQEPIGGASVDLAGMQVSSDAGGNYEITGIDAGRYDIRVRKDGYLDWVQPVTLPASTAWEPVAKGRYAITARIINQGAIVAPGFDAVMREGSPDGPVIANQRFPGLTRIESTDFAVIYEAGTEERTSTLYVLVDAGKEVDEFDESNNRRKIELSDTQTINQRPAITPIAPQTVKEGEELVFLVNAYDLDGDKLSLSATPLESGMAFTDNGDGTAQCRWVTVKGQAGAYRLTITATDGRLSTSEAVEITVSAVAPEPGDLDGDGDIDRDDLNVMRGRFNQAVTGADDPYDLNGDGVINILDFRQLINSCTRARCATE